MCRSIRVFSNNRRFSPQDMLLLHRSREAVAESVATRVLWQLRSEGIDGPWRAKLDTAYGDIARHFLTSLRSHEGDDAELRATRAAFHQWFKVEWRPEIYDDLMLKTLARIAGDQIGMLPPSRWLSDRFIRDMSLYAGRHFLIEGDGRALLGDVGAGWLTSGNQAKLDAILRQGPFDVGEERSPSQGLGKGTGVSASSSGPIRTDPADR